MGIPVHDEGNDVHPFEVRPGEIIGYEVWDNSPVTNQCVHLAKRQIFSPMQGFWYGQHQTFHVMRPYAIQTTFEREGQWSSRLRRFTRIRIIIPPYPYIWSSYCGRQVFLDWDWRVASGRVLHWAVAMPWFCRQCRSETLRDTEIFDIKTSRCHNEIPIR